MTNQPDDTPEWIKKRNAEKAEQQRKEAESLQRQQDALALVEVGGSDFWKRFTDRVVLNTRALEQLEGEELFGSTSLSVSGAEHNCHIIVERRSIHHGGPDVTGMNLYYAPGGSRIRCYYRDAKKNDIQLVVHGKEIRAGYEGTPFTAEQLADHIVETMASGLRGNVTILGENVG
jgi:hypothetical protein